MVASSMKYKDYRSLAALFRLRIPARVRNDAGMGSWANMAGLLGVVAIATALAQLSWRLTPYSSKEGVTVTQAMHHQARDVAQLSITELTDSHLFGLALAQPGGAINAPETTLNLTLRGIFALDSQRALAIIASGGADEQPYKVGDALPGGASVHEIASDKVILERSGRFETLTLPKESLDGLSVPLNGSTNGNPAPASRLGEIRNRLKANPSEAVSMNAIQPVMVNGQLKGYQLADNPYMPALREAGLMPGDVVTRVNGIAVTDQVRAAEMFNQLSNAGHVDLEVERGGVPTSLSVNLGR